MSTKELAKRLGLLRQRSRSSAGPKESVVSNQTFSHVIVIDFESTCWSEKNNYSQEIIEFPAVLLNTSTGEIESEFHAYVQPQEHPILSEFCTELTGITQMQVEAGIPLQICLSRFSRWLQNLQLEMGLVFPNRQRRCSGPSPSHKLCTFLTWSDWDLGVCLQYECKRKQLHKPDVLNSWIDLRSTYRLFYDRKPKGLNGALQDLGIQFSGREHSGLDDSRNTAKLASQMMRDGCVMKITRSLERAQSAVKPMFGNTTEDKKENPSTDKKENTLINYKPSSSRIPLVSCQINSHSENNTRNLNTKESSNSAQQSGQICQSLISPKTLLTSTTTTLWGNNSSMSVKKDAVRNLSSSVMSNCNSAHSNDGNSHVLCPTTVGCLSNLPQPNQLPGTRATVGFKEEDAELLVETEERSGSYDDVVLEGNDEIDAEYISGLDSGCYLWEEPTNLHSSRDLFMMRDNVSAENNSKTDMMTSELSTTSVPTKIMRSHVIVSGPADNMRQCSVVSEPNVYFAVPKVIWGSRTNWQKNILQPDKISVEVSKNSGLNGKVMLDSESFVPEKTSTPNTSFARSKPVLSQHIKHKQTPKPSFAIYTDPEKQTVAPSHLPSFISLCTPRSVLSSLSKKNLPSSRSCSSIPAKLKERGKITSPLCACGRRAKRQVVSNGGPNHGRRFYCCPVRRSGSGSGIQKGCEFFKWESSLLKSTTVASPAVRSSVSLCQINATLRRDPQQNSTLRQSC